MTNSDLKSRILVSIFIIMFYRFGTYLPLPYVDIQKIQEFSKLTKSGIFSMFNIFSGGSMSRASIFSLGIMPYITSSIIIQLIISTTPSLSKLREDGEFGVQKINFYTKMLAIFVCILQGFTMLKTLYAMNLSLTTPFYFYTNGIITVICSTMILLHLGEYISAKGIGNGTSLIIFSGLVAEAPNDFIRIIQSSYNGSISGFALIMLFVIFISMLIFITFFEKIYRLIYIQHSVRGYQMMMMKRAANEQQNFIPLKINPASVVPSIFGSSILLLIITLGTFVFKEDSAIGFFINNNFQHGKLLFILLYGILIFVFTFFYCNVIFDKKSIIDNLKRNAVFIPGVRPGKPTEELLVRILNRLAFIASCYLCVICLVPEFLSKIYGYSFFLGGTSLLICIGVIIDLMISIQTAILPAKYSKAVKKFK